MISFKVTGSTSRTKAFLKGMQKIDIRGEVEEVAQRGVDALMMSTPSETGLTASSWSYEIEQTGDKLNIYWINTNRNGTQNIAILLQYGHGTGSGGYVQGRDYINPAIQPIFDEISDRVWKRVTSA